MSQQQRAFDKAKALIDAANSEDPNQESAAGKVWPKELLYSHRTTDMLQRYAPTALVFIEHYMLDFAAKHPEYYEDKWLEIILKTWKNCLTRPTSSLSRVASNSLSH